MNGEDQFATTGPRAPHIIDCRSLYNPHNDAKLRRMTGRDKEVQDIVCQSRGAQWIIQDVVAYLIRQQDATVAFGCAYGKHRSVAMAEMVAGRMRDLGVSTTVIHTGAASMGRNA